jgi:carbon-monoxide dehydrogenase small subunit
MTSRLPVSVTINGAAREGLVEPRKTLADFIRQDLQLTGTHIGCEHGVCGACTILVDGEAVRSCLMLAVQAEGCTLLTIEGLASNGDALHPLQQGFRERHSFQCGFCTPGFTMSMLAFLRANPRPSRDEVRAALSSNLCRCTGYQSIIDGVLRGAELLNESEKEV